MRNLKAFKSNDSIIKEMIAKNMDARCSDYEVG